MDALRELASAESFQKDHGMPVLSSDRSRTPATPPVDENTRRGPQNYSSGFAQSLTDNAKISPNSTPPEIRALASPLNITRGNNTMKASPHPTRRSKVQESPFDSNSIGVDADPRIQQLVDYCSGLKAEMDIISGKINGNANPDVDSSNDATADDCPSYRHGQIGAFRHIPRFDQASRTIVSDNWRAQSAADTARRPQLASLMTAGNAGSTSSPQSPFAYTPTRSPLVAPLNSNIASGFAQPSPHPPPTPVSLSTPVTMAFNHGPGHAHHSSTSSLELGTPEGISARGTATGNSTSMAPASPSTGPVAARISSPSLCGGSTLTNSASVNGNGKSQPANGNDRVHDKNTTTFPVTSSADTLGYCFVRPNGTRTRLVPVDMLPYPLQGIPANESENGRLVTLPVPQGLGADGRSSNMQALKAVVPPGGNSNGDAIQSHIDRILAAPSQHTPTSSNSTLNNTNTTTLTLSQPQNHPTTTSSPSTTTMTTTPKRMKIYCDKWVHEGVCAFTQQGCKYKHEMPSDKATQHQLGLFLGYPVWWKRRQAELSRVQPTQPTQPNTTTAAGSGAGAAAGGSGNRDGNGVVGAAGDRSLGISQSRARELGVSDPSIGNILLPRQRYNLPVSSQGAGSGTGSEGEARVDFRNERVGVPVSRAANVFWRRTVAGPQDAEGSNDPNLSAAPPSQAPRQSTANGGLAASRWGGGPPAPNSNSNPAVGNPRERLLGPSWRTPSTGESDSHTRGYPDLSLESYDGAGPDFRYHPPAGELERDSSVFGNSSSTAASPFAGYTITGGGAWPWDNPHYIHRASRTQQYRPQAQFQPSNVTPSFNAACTFSFPTAATASTTTSPSSPSTSTSSLSMSTSPYGPIAPPLRNANLNHPHQTSNSNDNDNNPPPTTAAANNAGMAVDARPAREVSNSYTNANTNAYGTAVKSQRGGDC